MGLIDAEVLKKDIMAPSIYDINKPDFLGIVNEQPIVDDTRSLEILNTIHAAGFTLSTFKTFREQLHEAGFTISEFCTMLKEYQALSLKFGQKNI